MSKNKSSSNYLERFLIKTDKVKEKTLGKIETVLEEKSKKLQEKPTKSKKIVQENIDKINQKVKSTKRIYESRNASNTLDYGINYNEEIAKCEKLGAIQFQKVVFKVEKLKFKILKTLCPNFLNYFDKYCDHKKRKTLKKAKTLEEKKEIIRKTKFAKLAMRKEFYDEKNRNYHIDKNQPTEIYKYLEWNKNIHKNGLIKDAILIPILLVGTILGFMPALPILIIEILSAGINFECINIQNYNMYRIKKSEKILKKIEQKKISQNINNYGEAAEVIYKSVEKDESLPTFSDVIENIDNIEQLRQMRALIQNKRKERESEKERKGRK